MQEEKIEIENAKFQLGNIYSTLSLILEEMDEEHGKSEEFPHRRQHHVAIMVHLTAAVVIQPHFLQRTDHTGHAQLLLGTGHGHIQNPQFLSQTFHLVFMSHSLEHKSVFYGGNLRIFCLDTDAKLGIRTNGLSVRHF